MIIGNIPIFTNHGAVGEGEEAEEVTGGYQLSVEGLQFDFKLKYRAQGSEKN